MTEYILIKHEDSDSFSDLALTVFQKGEATLDEFAKLLHYCKTLPPEEIISSLDSLSQKGQPLLPVKLLRS